MKSAKSIFFFSLILAVAAFTQACSAFTTQPANIILPEQFAVDSSSSNSILSATIQIIAFPAEHPNTNDHVVYERGLASLIQVGSEIILVSHDHWSALTEIAQVQFLDANSSLLAEISGTEFRSLIRYQDQGTLLLSIPPELNPAYLSLLAARSEENENLPIIAGTLAEPQSLQVGQVVSIAYRIGDDRSQVGLLPAAVTEITEVEGKAALKLQSLDGTVILPGDSGGGIWLDGKLVGNMWMSERVPEQGILTLVSSQSSTRYLDTSIAAQLPNTIQTLFAQSTSTNPTENLADEALMDW